MIPEPISAVPISQYGLIGPSSNLNVINKAIPSRDEGFIAVLKITHQH